MCSSHIMCGLQRLGGFGNSGLTFAGASIDAVADPILAPPPSDVAASLGSTLGLSVSCVASSIRSSPSHAWDVAHCLPA